MSKRFLSLIAFLCMIGLLISLTACGGSPADSGTTAGETPTAEVSESEEPAAEAPVSEEPVTEEPANEEQAADISAGEESASDTAGKFDPIIDVHFARYVDDIIETNVLPFYEGQTLEDNFWLDTYRDELGINVVYDWVSSSGEYNRRLNLALAGSEMPQTFETDLTMVMQMAEAGLIQPMDEAFDQYASPFLKEVMYQEGDAHMNAAVYDGQIYGIPQMGGSIDAADVMFIRRDWLNALNMEAPTTMDEFVAMLEAFNAADFDGNGADDSVGFVLAGTDPWGSVGNIVGIANGFGAYPNIWVDVNGKLEYGSIQPEMRQTLEFLRDLFNKGLLDSEFVVKDGGVASEAAVNGLSGVIFGKQWLPIWPLNNSFNNDPNADWTAYDLPSATGSPVKAQMPLGTIAWQVVSAEFEHPEAIIMMMNLFVEKCWGVTGDNAKYSTPPQAEGVWKLSPVWPTPPHKNLDTYLTLENARATGDTSAVTGEARTILDKLEMYAAGGTEGFALWGWERIYGAAPTPYSVFNTRVEEGRTVMDGYMSAPTETAVQRMSSISALQNETFMKIIIGESDISAFDEFVESFNSMGGAQITEEVNAWYSAR